MQNIELLINICKKYIRGLIGLDEFQKQIEAYQLNQFRGIIYDKNS